METVIRILFIYVFLLVTMRLLGKREFGELAPFDLVVLLLIPELISQAAVREDFSLTNSVIAVSTLLAAVFITGLVSYKSDRVAKLIEGEPSVLVQHGFLVPEELNRAHVRPGEVLAAMHKAGLEHMSQVKWAILESDGKISVVPWGHEDRHQRSRDEKLAH